MSKSLGYVKVAVLWSKCVRVFSRSKGQPKNIGVLREESEQGVDEGVSNLGALS